MSGAKLGICARSATHVWHLGIQGLALRAALPGLWPCLHHWCVGGLLAALALCSFGGPRAALGQPPCELQWISSVPIHGYFFDVAPSGDVFVSDAASQTLRRYSIDGTLLHSWGNVEGAPWKLVRPFGVTVSPEGRVYVADFGQDIVLIFETNGTYVGSLGASGSGPGQMLRPHDVAIDSQGSIYVADRGNDQIDKFTSDGTYLRSWGSHGFGPDQFAGITCLAIGQSDDVFAADQLGYVRRFTNEGVFVTRFDGTESGEQSIDRAYGLTLTRNGTLLHVIDWGDSEITSFSVDGDFYSRCGRPGHTENRYFFPIDADHLGDTILVLDAGNNRIVLLDESQVPVVGTTWSRVKSILLERE